MRETYIDRMIVHSVFEEMTRTKYSLCTPLPGDYPSEEEAGNLSPAMGMRLRTKIKIQKHYLRSNPNKP